MDMQFRTLIHSAARRANLKVVAAKMDACYSTLAAQINPNNYGTERFRSLDVGEMPQLVSALDDGTPASGALEVVDYLAREIGAVVFRLPRPKGDAATAQLAEVMSEFSDLVRAHAEMDEDRRRDPKEVERVRGEARQAQAAIQAYLAALEQEGF